MIQMNITEKCEKCESTQLCKLRSAFIKKCTVCGHEMHWPLDEGQKPLIGSNRGDRRNAEKDGRSRKF